MTTEIVGRCSINACPRPATHEEIGESVHWRFVVYYCDEHHREAELGTPLGPVGIDVTRIEVHGLGAEEPETGGILPTVATD
jgi:hypothetical protein